MKQQDVDVLDRSTSGPAASVNSTDGQLPLHSSDAADSRLDEIKQILNHAAMPLTDKCDLIAEWVHCIEARLCVSGQVDQKPRSGRPEGGVARAARELPVRGKTPEARRMFIRYAVKISTIHLEAKGAARAAGLDDNQSALLDIAGVQSAEAQINRVQEIAARRALPRRKSGGPKKQPANNTISAAEVEHLKTELAAANERQRELEEELESARGMASPTPAVKPSMKAPTTDEPLPSFDDQDVFNKVIAAWTKATDLRAALVGASPLVLERFIATVHAGAAS